MFHEYWLDYSTPVRQCIVMKSRFKPIDTDYGDKEHLSQETWITEKARSVPLSLYLLDAWHKQSIHLLFYQITILTTGNVSTK